MEECVNVLYVPKMMCSDTFVYLAKVPTSISTATVNVNVSVHSSEESELFCGFAGALLAD